MGTITFVMDWATYSLITVAWLINWDTLKGNIAFTLGIMLVIVRMYKYICDIQDRNEAKRELRKEKEKKETEKANENNNS
jgi:hypothetical protein